MEGTHHRGVFRRRRWRWGVRGSESAAAAATTLGSEELAGFQADVWAVSEKLRKPPWVGVRRAARLNEGSWRSETATVGTARGIRLDPAAASRSAARRRRRWSASREAARRWRARVGSGDGLCRREDERARRGERVARLRREPHRLRRAVRSARPAGRRSRLDALGAVRRPVGDGEAAAVPAQDELRGGWAPSRRGGGGWRRG